MSEMREKLEVLRAEINKAKKLPFMQKAMAAETIAERSLDLLESVVNKAEGLDQQLKKFEHDYFGVNAAFEGVKNVGN